MKISVIILSWNTKQLLRQCLQSLEQESKRVGEQEVIVVDNGSSDESPEMVKKEFPQVRLIRNKKNLGFAKGNNQALRQAQGEVIMLLNSDTVVHKGAIEKLAISLQKEVRPGRALRAVSPLLILPDGKPQIDYYMKFPNLWQIFLYHNPVFRPLALKIPFLRYLICFSAKNSPFSVDQLPGAALMASKEVWDKVGLLDEDYSFLYEDVDWCWRAKKLGCSLKVIPDAKITHIGGASWKKKLKEESFEFYKQYFSSMLLFVEKNYGRGKKTIFRMALITNWLLSSFLMLPVAIFSPTAWKKVLDKLKLIRYFLFVN